MKNGFEDYREVISSVAENKQLLEALKKSVAGLAAELNSFHSSTDKKLHAKREQYIDEISYFEKILLRVEKNLNKSTKDYRKSTTHNIKDLLKLIELDSDAFADTEVSGIAIDSRLVKEGNIFFALQGEKENGEKYIDQAFENGASFVFANKSYQGQNSKIIKVDNTLETLKKLAIEYRKSLNCKVLAITGSVGKTSCKNFAYSVLSEKYNCAKTYANYNTVTGICMSVLDMAQDTELMVLELGVDSIGEMDQLVEIANPDYAIISNVSDSHLEKFGSKKAIFDEKIKIVDKFTADSVLVTSGECEFLDDYNTDKFKLIKVFEDEVLYQKSLDMGIESALVKNVKITDIGTAFTIKHGDKEDNFAIKLFGKHLAFNAAIVIMVCESIGVPFDLAKIAVIETETDIMRFDIAKLEGYKIINDAYNSSYKSLEAAIKTARELTKGKLYVMMGDILEIGGDAKQKHAEIGKELSALGIDYPMFYGDLMQEASKTYQGKNVKFFDSLDDAAMFVLNNIANEDTFLVKASRSIALERVCDLVIMNIIRTRFVDILLDIFGENS